MRASDPASRGPVEREPDPETVFLIAPNAGVWTVTKDGAFYGDYLKEEHAQASAQCAVAATLANGGAAKACLLPGPATGPETPQVLTALEAVVCDRPSRYPVSWAPRAPHTPKPTTSACRRL